MPILQAPITGVGSKIDENFYGKRSRTKCPVAMCQVGNWHFKQRNFSAALSYYSKASELDNAESNGMLGEMYLEGKGVEKDESKAVYLWEKSAIAGHPEARHILGSIDWKNGQQERAIKHWLIAA